MYFTGGSNQDCVKNFFAYDIASQKVIDEGYNQLNQARQNHASCVLGNRLYVFGGNQSQRLLSLEVIEIGPDAE